MRPFAKKSLGQHWLDDPAILRDIVASASIAAEDTVLEIGPGPGNLTRLLTEQASRVIAVELDDRLASQLPGRIKTDNLSVVHEDILRFDFRPLPPKYKVVANIPYYLTGKLLQVLCETANPPSLAVLLIQKEVAERAAAQPRAMSILSVTLQFYWRARLGIVVPARAFTPPPKVDSQLLLLERRSKPLFPDVDPQEFFRLVKAGFAQPRKTLLNNLHAGLHYSRPEAESVLERASLDGQRRPQTLSLAEWQQLYLAVHA